MYSPIPRLSVRWDGVGCGGVRCGGIILRLEDFLRVNISRFEYTQGWGRFKSIQFGGGGGG